MGCFILGFKTKPKFPESVIYRKMLREMVPFKICSEVVV